jgi:hypothetical protein
MIFGSIINISAEESEPNEVVEVNNSSVLLDNGTIVPFGATGLTTFGYGVTKTTLTLRDSYNIPVKVEVWVERNTLSGPMVKITRFSLLSYSGALISDVTTSLDTSKMNPGTGKTATATLYINYTIAGLISGQTIFGLDVTNGGSGYFFVT